MQSEVRNQLRILETIDRTISKRKLERDNEQTLRAAKSRSKGADPERAAKIREEAKQVMSWRRERERRIGDGVGKVKGVRVALVREGEERSESKRRMDEGR